MSYGHLHRLLHTPWPAPASSPRMAPHGARGRTAQSCGRVNAPGHDPPSWPHHRTRRWPGMWGRGVAPALCAESNVHLRGGDSRTLQWAARGHRRSPSCGVREVEPHVNAHGRSTCSCRPTWTLLKKRPRHAPGVTILAFPRSATTPGLVSPWCHECHRKPRFTGSALHVRLFLENTLQAFCIFNGLRSHHGQRAVR
jgi:hypothetical protein